MSERKRKGNEKEENGGSGEIEGQKGTAILIQKRGERTRAWKEGEGRLRDGVWRSTWGEKGRIGSKGMLEKGKGVECGYGGEGRGWRV